MEVKWILKWRTLNYRTNFARNTKVNWIELYDNLIPTSSTPIFRQASKKLSTLRRQRAIVSFGWNKTIQHLKRCLFKICLIKKWINVFIDQHTTAGDGTWMLPTDRGRTWLAKWHRTTPSVKAEPTSLGKVIFKRLSIDFLSCSINSVSSFCRSNSRRIVKLSFSAGESRFQDTLLKYFNEKSDV